jgi:hypothetical protein
MKPTLCSTFRLTDIKICLYQAEESIQHYNFVLPQTGSAADFRRPWADRSGLAARLDRQSQGQRVRRIEDRRKAAWPNGRRARKIEI